MFKTILAHVGKYKKFAVLAPLMIVVEVLIEVSIPYMMSVIVDCGIGGAPLTSKTGVVVQLLLRLGFGDKSGTDLIVSTGLVMLVLGIIGTVCNPLWLKLIYKHFMIHRYENMSSFRSTRAS